MKSQNSCKWFFVESYDSRFFSIVGNDLWSILSTSLSEDPVTFLIEHSEFMEWWVQHFSTISYHTCPPYFHNIPSFKKNIRQCIYYTYYESKRHHLVKYPLQMEALWKQKTQKPKQQSQTSNYCFIYLATHGRENRTQTHFKVVSIIPNHWE